MSGIPVYEGPRDGVDYELPVWERTGRPAEASDPEQCISVDPADVSFGGLAASVGPNISGRRERRAMLDGLMPHLDVVVEAI